MAVQAQYPSNVLFPDSNRDGEEGYNMHGGGAYNTLQSKAEEFLHHPQMLYGNGVGFNPRKRFRESVTAIAETPVNLFPLQSQTPPRTLHELSQLHNQQQPAIVSGLGLALQEQQKQQRGLVLPSVVSSFLSEDLATQIKHQNDEIDRFLQAQVEHLQRTLAENRERHHRELLAAAEDSVQRRLREKDAEVEKAARRNGELEERVAHLEAEAQAWQARARAQEEAATSLQTQLQHAMIGGGAQDEREKLGCGSEMAAEDAESAYVDPGRVMPVVPLCRVCRNQAVSVVFLPCRHLCLCNRCDAAVDACPICHCLKTASLEIYLP